MWSGAKLWNDWLIGFYAVAKMHLVIHTHTHSPTVTVVCCEY